MLMRRLQKIPQPLRGRFERLRKLPLLLVPPRLLQRAHLRVQPCNQNLQLVIESIQIPRKPPQFPRVNAGFSHSLILETRAFRIDPKTTKAHGLQSVGLCRTLRAMERERKFLVTQKPPNLSRYPHAFIEQGYLALDNGQDGHFEVRLRRKNGRFTLTVKKKKSEPGRLEKEIPLPPTSAKKLWPLTKGRRVAKTRYDIPFRNYTIELDIYRGKSRGLITAEVEFTSTAAMRKFKPPPWMKKEITGRSKYANARLAIFGWKRSRWSRE